VVPRQCCGQGRSEGQPVSEKQRPDQKIDAAVAVMMALSRAMVEDEEAKGLEGFLDNPIIG
jgi:phage terminase large subunit-like protein